MTPHSYLTGELTDISNVCNFKWFEWIKYRKAREGFPMPSEKLGRCLGSAKNQGNQMSQYILTAAGEVIPTQTLRSLSESEKESEYERELRREFDRRIKIRYGDHRGPPPNWIARRRRQDDGDQYDDPFWKEDTNGVERSEFLYEDDVES